MDPQPALATRRRGPGDHPRGSRNLPRQGRGDRLRLELGTRGGGRLPARPTNWATRTRSATFGSDAEAAEAGFRPCWQITAYMCTDPDEHGHRNVNQVDRDEAGGPADQVRTQIDAEEAARIKRRQVIAGNKQWRAATAQRQEFLRGLAARKTPPARALTRVLAAVGGCDWDLINALQQANSLAGELLGFKARPPAGTRSPR